MLLLWYMNYDILGEANKASRRKKATFFKLSIGRIIQFCGGVSTPPIETVVYEVRTVILVEKAVLPP